MHRLASGQRIAEATICTWLQARQESPIDTLYVVTRPNDVLAELIAETWNDSSGLRLLTAADANLGMGHSLAAAAHAIPVAPLVIGLADMPFVQAPTIGRIAEKLLGSTDPNVIVQPNFAGTAGNPLGFGRGHHAALCRLRGDAGARERVQQARTGGHYVELKVDDPGILQDIDTPADVQ